MFHSYFIVRYSRYQKKKTKMKRKKHEQIECCFALRLIYFSLLLWYSNWRYDTISLCWLVSNIKRKKKTSNKNYSKQIYKVQTVKTTLTHSSCSCDMLYYLFWFLKCTIFFCLIAVFFFVFSFRRRKKNWLDLHLLPKSGIASETWGSVSATKFKNTVRDRRIVTPINNEIEEKYF